MRVAGVETLSLIFDKEEHQMGWIVWVDVGKEAYGVFKWRQRPTTTHEYLQIQQYQSWDGLLLM